MVKRTRHAHSAALKGKVEFAALREDKTLVELAKLYELQPNPITEWKRQLFERASEVISSGTAGPPVDLTPLHAKIGQQALVIDFGGAHKSRSRVQTSGALFGDRVLRRCFAELAFVFCLDWVKVN
jgi:transposase